jgi:hypothetical protein
MKKVRLAYGAAAVAAAAPALALGANAAQAANAIPAKTHQVSCGAAPHHWTVFKDGGSRYCFGYNGGTDNFRPSFLIASKECGGNNIGWWSQSGSTTSFGPGKTYRGVPNNDVFELHISSWSGTDTCP